MQRITVLGIGNILLRDEGFGVRVIETLNNQYRFQENVQVLDGGTMGMGLMPFLSGTAKLIIVDAVAGSLPAGSVYELRNDDVKAYFRNRVSMHELGIQDVLAAFEILEEPIDEVVVLGVQPEIIDTGLELSETVLPAVHQVTDAVIKQLRAWHVEVCQV